MIHTIAFNGSVICYNHYGVSFYNETTKSRAFSFGSSTRLPAKLITYDVKWHVKPVKGDCIRWQYDGTGSYQDVDHVRMLPQDLGMINCEDVPNKHCDDAA